MSWDIILIIIGIILLAIGIIGAVAPVLPGPPLSFAGLILLHFSAAISFSPIILWVFGVLSLLSVALDYWLPIWGTRLAKGNRHAIQGATIGLILGLFVLPPFGIIFGPFIGALVASLVNGMSGRDALFAALGSFVGLFTAVIFKLILSVAMIIIAIIGFF